MCVCLVCVALPDLNVQSDPKEPVSGQPFSLKCSLQGVYPPGSVEMRWLHGDRVIAGPAGTAENADEVFHNYELRTKQQLHATSADYRCEAELVLQNKLIKTKKQTLPLQFKVVPERPSISTSFLRKPLGEPASFTCKADPSFSISWARTGSQGAWAPPGHWNLSVSAGVSLVLIERLQPGDSGNYTCILKNETTKVTLSITIEVSYAPKNTSLTRSEPSVKEGDPLTLTCRGDASPEPQILWTKLNSTLPDSWIRSTGKGQSTLTALSLAPEHSGTYQCEISNGIGRETLTTTLHVLYAPKNTSLTRSEPSVKEGDPLTLTCRGEASPEPQILWTKLNSTLPDSWIRSTGKGQSTLTALSLAPEHSGTYQCEISNGIGRETLTTTLHVLYAPKNTSLTRSEHSVKEGDPLTLTCRGDASPEPQILWTKLNSTLPDSWIHSTGKGQSTLTALSLAPEHSGTYQCEISNGIGRETLTTTLHVLYAPKNTSLTRSEPSVKEGDPLTLTCRGEASPEPQILWTKLNSTLPDSWIRSTGKGQSTLTALSLAPEHSGTYQCEISNGIGRETLTTTLHVLYAPKNTSLTRSEPSVKEGDPLTLTCRGEASPEPQILWTKLNSTLPDSWIRSTGKGQSTLTALSLAPEHSGTYQCEISNGIGRETLTTTLHVLYAPKNTSLTRSEHSVKEGDPLTLTCRGDASPEPQILWTKLNSTLPDSWIHSTGKGQSTLTALSLAPEHSGTYQCEISNGIGRETLTTTLHVLYAPKNTSLTRSEPSVKEGDPLTLTCRGEASPEPQILWTKLNSTLPDSWIRSTGKGQSTLTALSLAPEHSGTYQCEISNGIGRETLTTTLHVLYAPKNTSLTRSEPSVKEGDPLTLTCRGEASPEPQILWTKLNSTLPGSWIRSTGKGQSTLTALSLAPEHSGTYQCEISNGIGRETLTTTLHVLYAPKNTSLTRSEPTVKEGDPLTLTCRGDASPEPQILWTKLNSTLPDSWIRSTGKGQSTLTALSLAPEHSGTYQCEISNGIGREALTTTLHVLYGPRNIGADSGVITGNEGQPLKINCTWDANPKPDIQWLKLGSEKRDHWEISESGNKSQLRINAMGSEDLGVYTCLIRNKIGEIWRNTTVRATDEQGVQSVTITIATALPALGLSIFAALVGWLRKNRQSTLSINP
ncbi:hemicentin-2-like [Polyodon spathula]|uniref:hemicentin-2-like n=1 Tax=Polyodon spathula TaxID=7913 RepID=UPI001B7F0B7E|nr:hemicentin-2-like [Polyodon spathula]